MSGSIPHDAPRPRLCKIKKWPDFNGYGFNLHAEKGKQGQYIGKVDPGSPALYAGMKEGDRLVEINGINIGNENHSQVVTRIKASGASADLLVLDSNADLYYRERKLVVRGDFPNVQVCETPDNNPATHSGVNGDAVETVAAAEEPLKTETQVESDSEPSQPDVEVRDEPEVEQSAVSHDEQAVVVEEIGAQDETRFTEEAEPDVPEPDYPRATITSHDETPYREPSPEITPPTTYRDETPYREPSPEITPPTTYRDETPYREPSPETTPPREPSPPRYYSPPRDPSPARDPSPPPQGYRDPSPPPQQYRDPSPPRAQAAAASPPVSPTSPDPSGLKLGMSVSEMREQIRRSNKRDVKKHEGSFQDKYKAFQRL